MNNNLVDILSLILQIENLQENREQSAHNDVQTANDKQAELILSEINRRLDKQDTTMQTIIEILDEIREAIDH